MGAEGMRKQKKDLFHVLENRKRNLRPVFCTTTWKASDLAASLSGRSGGPSRLRGTNGGSEFMP